MNIDTDIVKNKTYSSAIEPSLLKHSQEYRVLATLRYLYQEKFNTMTTGEAPDLQDCVSGIGIEVTSAVKEETMKVLRVFSDLCQREPEEVSKLENIIKSSGYSFVSLKDKKVAISTSGTADGEKYFFQESIRRKTKRLQQYRENFKEIGLAIILPGIPTSHAEKHLMEWSFEFLDESSDSFDFVYVISHRFCVYCDVKENVSEKHLLTQDENQMLAKIGRMTAEGELSMTDKEWL